MEAINNQSFETNKEINKNLTHSQEYDFKINDDNYKLTINVYSNQTIHFYIKQTNKITIYYYEKEYTYDEITKTLILIKDYYNDIMKVFNFYNTAITKKKILLKEEKNN